MSNLTAAHDVRWLLDPGVSYLNHGGYGALAEPVAAAADALRRDLEANPTDAFTRQWRDRVAGVRAAVAHLLRADPRCLVFVGNATTGTATVLSSLPREAGDHIVVADHRYPSVRTQLDAAVRRRGVEVTEVPVPLSVRTEQEIVDLLIQAVTPRTRLVVVDAVASPTGMVFPVAAIARAARARGVRVLVDAAHAPGQLDVDLGATGADFWVGNLHKWGGAPRAVAALYVAPEWQDVVRPLVPSHDYDAGFLAAFDWTGTFDPVPLLTVPAALDFWGGLGWDEVRRTQRALAREGAHRVAERLGTHVPVADDLAAAMRLVALPVALDATASADLVARLTTRHRVTVNVTSHQGSSYVRVCGQVYNRPDDYERLADALVAELAG